MVFLWHSPYTVGGSSLNSCKSSLEWIQWQAYWINFRVSPKKTKHSYGSSYDAVSCQWRKALRSPSCSADCGGWGRWGSLGLVGAWGGWQMMAGYGGWLGMVGARVLGRISTKCENYAVVMTCTGPQRKWKIAGRWSAWYMPTALTRRSCWDPAEGEEFGGIQYTDEDLIRFI